LLNASFIFYQIDLRFSTLLFVSVWPISSTFLLILTQVDHISLSSSFDNCLIWSLELSFSKLCPTLKFGYSHSKIGKYKLYFHLCNASYDGIRIPIGSYAYVHPGRIKSNVLPNLSACLSSCHALGTISDAMQGCCQTYGN